MDEHDPTDDEMKQAEHAEAEALARALERGTAAPDLPEDALEAAALLRYSAGDDELGQTRMDAILEEVFENAKPRAAAEPAPSPFLAWLKWLVPVGALAAAGVYALVFVGPDALPVATRLPTPDVALLEAQVRSASQAEGSEVALASAMGEYRGAVLGSLSERYGR